MIDVKWIYKIGLSLIFLTIQFWYGSHLHIQKHQHVGVFNKGQHHHYHHHHQHIHPHHLVSDLHSLEHCHLHSNHLPDCINSCSEVFLERQSNPSKKNKEKKSYLSNVHHHTRVTNYYKLPHTPQLKSSVTDTCYNHLPPRAPPVV